MDKISQILPSTPRITSVDLSDGPTFRGAHMSKIADQDKLGRRTLPNDSNGSATLIPSNSFFPNQGSFVSSRQPAVKTELGGEQRAVNIIANMEADFFNTRVDKLQQERALDANTQAIIDQPMRIQLGGNMNKDFTDIADSSDDFDEVTSDPITEIDQTGDSNTSSIAASSEAAALNSDYWETPQKGSRLDVMV